MPDERTFVDPLGCIYLDSDGDLHFDGPKIAELFEVPLDEVIRIVRRLVKAEGAQVQTLYAPKVPNKARSN